MAIEAEQKKFTGASDEARATCADRCFTIQDRLDGLADYAILDTPDEQGFDDLAKLAADIFEAPIAAITLFDADRLWLKAKVGVDVKEAPLEESICIHGLRGSDLLVVPNALEDPRFGHLPGVRADDGVRFYAGARLTNLAGVPLGMICVADTVPRPGISSAQTRILRTLAAQVVTQLELRRECRQRARLIAQAEQARQEAVAAAAAKTSFLANMSHEIRTPLNSIIGFTDLLLEDQELGARQRRQVQLVHNSGTALLTVINDILDFSKSEAGKLDLNVEAFSITSMVDNTMSIVRNVAEAKGLALAASISPEVTGFHSGDQQRLRQILLNLVGNAIKFTHEGGVRTGVELEKQDGQTDLLRVMVSDTGCGVPRDRQHRLFQNFSQADSSISRQFGGSGLGLAISKRLIELMGGNIGYASNPDGGSTFWFTVPLPRATSPEAACEDRDWKHQNAGARILLVEDVPVNQELGCAILTRQGHQVDVADNGKQAVAAVQSKTYDLVLMDIHMPVMDGIAATKAIRQLACRASRVLPGQVQSFRDAGMNGHVAKPINRQELAEVMSQLLADEQERMRA
jgi:signal transduction histidine kinase